MSLRDGVRNVVVFAGLAMLVSPVGVLLYTAVTALLGQTAIVEYARLLGTLYTVFVLAGAGIGTYVFVDSGYSARALVEFVLAFILLSPVASVVFAALESAVGEPLGPALRVVRLFGTFLVMYVGAYYLSYRDEWLLRLVSKMR
ncbi:hypothetical protein AUR64_05325 [Haloprofundus marisrubri]|uniref:Uncharacterized protein n=1 Tax=Haloprofundus marisrubri TaxID=1514971 RepID=A0A0W1RDC7_9EURY|nr:hypothetical protein [Haloprofundus marisrubri]KTG11131.1 hypothetical protein AUR64_05325 [Haloprofundus marisrubri]